MKPFSYAEFGQSPDPIRTDLSQAYRRAWIRIASPGTWLNGEQRVAVAAETRLAQSCKLCRERKRALAPGAITGEHDHGGALTSAMVDAIHRVTTDAGRLTRTWYQGLLEQGLTAEEYVEALGVSVCVISIDRFQHAMGLPLEALPSALQGESTQLRPEDLVEDEAWVPMQTAVSAAKRHGIPGGRAPFVIRALSLVPDEVRAWSDLSAVQYLDPQAMLCFGKIRGFGKTRALSRSQIELVAGRVSALNECFY